MPTEELRAIELLGLVPYGRVATSLGALPFLAIARHIVSEGSVILRMHVGRGHHEACKGSVVAYAADNMCSGETDVWSVQFTGTAEAITPTPDELRHFTGAPAEMNGEPYEPVYLRIRPRFSTVDRMEYTAPQTADAAQ
ncbi:pyridoxamine 5'-phosphate oxidase family protein [Streptomyces sp. NBC_00344]|uniref:pyridoxamine 5'-phosphate oxidase family protein n=1 Tax=Streptomyces sp. NBC_00344 TaxID=2975720 RepID=UPI002E1F10EA